MIKAESQIISSTVPRFSQLSGILVIKLIKQIFLRLVSIVLHYSEMKDAKYS